MEHIRHLSFDVWNTLIEGSRSFQPVRSALVAEIFDIEPTIAKHLYTETKSHFDALAEREGRAHSCDEVYDELIRRVIQYRDGSDDLYGERERLRRGTEELFRTYPPTVLPTTIETLQTLHAIGYTISIGSNTNFISGTLLSEILDRWIPFEFKVFSDLCGYSKPHREFFNLVLDGARATKTVDRPAGRADLARSEILHIGDNMICDGQGAIDAGMEFFYVKNPAEVPNLLSALAPRSQKQALS